jgi:hypothetical protein
MFVDFLRRTRQRIADLVKKLVGNRSCLYMYSIVGHFDDMHLLCVWTVRQATRRMYWVDIRL